MHDASGFVSAPIFRRLLVMLLTLFCINSDNGRDRTRDLSNARLEVNYQTTRVALIGCSCNSTYVNVSDIRFTVEKGAIWSLGSVLR
jgi:hypothetical protein